MTPARLPTCPGCDFLAQAHWNRFVIYIITSPKARLGDICRSCLKHRTRLSDAFTAEYARQFATDQFNMDRASSSNFYRQPSDRDTGDVVD